MGQVLRRLTDLGIIEIVNGEYALREQVRATVDDLSEMLQLKSDFLTRLHRKGGEFFEHYLLTLLKKRYA
jgi:hypothetical protein